MYSDAAPRCRRQLLFPLTCQRRRNISRRLEVYESRKRHGSMTQTTTTVSAGMPAKMKKSMDRGSDAAPRCRQQMLFPLTCQHRRNISRRLEVYGSRKRRDSMTQTTTTVSAGMPARMQKSMDRGSDAAPRCRRQLLFPLTCQHRRNISRRLEVHGSRKRHGSMTQTTTTVSAGMAVRMQQSMDRGSHTSPRCRRPLLFPLTCQHRRNISRRLEVYGSRKQRGSMTQTTTTVSAGIPARMQSLWNGEATRFHYVTL